MRRASPHILELLATLLGQAKLNSLDRSCAITGSVAAQPTLSSKHTNLDWLVATLLSGSG